MRVIKKFEMRKLKHGCGVVAQNFLLNYSLFKITVNPSQKVKFLSEKQKDMSDDGMLLDLQVAMNVVLNYCAYFRIHRCLRHSSPVESSSVAQSFEFESSFGHHPYSPPQDRL